MAKTKAKWLNRDVANPDHVGAETLPYDAVHSIKEKMQLLESGHFKISTSQPNPANMYAGEMQMWFDSTGPAIRVTHKDANNTVRTGTFVVLS